LWPEAPSPQQPTSPGPAEVPGGEIEEVGGDIIDVEEAGGEIVEVEETTENIIKRAPIPEAPAPRTFPGLSGAFSEFIGAGITILTMTDCDTVNGIVALVRVSKGGLLNVYEDQMMKELERMQ